ncbi:MAG TPA: hypothetical protein PKU97_19150, partial [Kofleriaceae bacterium]|nr:hypothetical protein [Kofleriaceae bacterium]
MSVPDRQLLIVAPMQGTVISIAAAPGRRVRAGEPLLYLEAMKMEHAVEAEADGVVESLAVAVGQAVRAGELLGRMAASAASAALESAPRASAAVGVE